MSVGSLFTAISGLRTHQSSLNIIGNNLANINTVGYKKSRSTFREIFNRVVAQGSAPTEQTGGVNPMQIGFGAQLSTVDTLHAQGSLRTTGNPTDLSIRGNGYFVLRNTQTVGGEKNYNLTRAGNFSVDLAGNLIYTPNGFRVQGWMANTAGKIDTSAPIDDVKLPLQEKVARATDDVRYGGNLDARAGQAVIVSGGADVGLSSAYVPSQGNISQEKHTINVGAVTGQPGVFEASMENGDAVEISQGQELTLIPADTEHTLTADLSSVTQEGKAIISVSNGQVSLDSTSTELLRTELEAASLTIPVNNALEDGVYTITFVQDATLGLAASLEGGPKQQVAAGMTLAKGDISKAIVVTFDDITGLAAGDIEADVGVTEVTTGDIGTTGITPSAVSFSIPSASRLPTDTHMVSVSDRGNGRFTASLNGGPEVEIAKNGTFTLTSGDLGGRTSAKGNPLSVTFGSEIKAGTVEIKTISRSRRVSMTTYDALGGAHNVEITFTKIGPEFWVWDVTDVSNIAEGSTFEGEGGLKVNTLTGAVTMITPPPTVPISFTPANEAEKVNIPVDVRSFEGITQFAADYDVTAISQNGIPVGELFALRVDNEGRLVGVFTNGLAKNLAQISLGMVPNANGLERAGDTLFTESLSSGTARFASPGKIGLGEIQSGSLEMSNVDLTEEFTALIIAERGFQANSRVVVTSDEILVEALGLKR